MKKLLLIFTLAAFVLSCSENEEAVQPDLDSVNFGKAVGEGLARGLAIDFSKPTVFKYQDEKEKDEIIANIIEEIYEVDLKTKTNDNGGRVSEEIAVDMLVNPNGKTVTIYPSSGTTTGDDEDCGGKKGDGWKSYGTCMTEKCVKELSSKAAHQLVNQMSPGKCLDVRVKRNTFNARVCARVVSCD